MPDTCWQECDEDCELGPVHCQNLHQPSWKWVDHAYPCPMAASDEVIGKVTSIIEDENGVTFTAKLAPGWTVERIEEGLRHFFWGGPDDYNFNEVAMPNLREELDAGPTSS